MRFQPLANTINVLCLQNWEFVAATAGRGDNGFFTAFKGSRIGFSA
jgi:hypothetical protein